MTNAIEARSISKHYRLGTSQVLDDTFRDWLVKGLGNSWQAVRGAASNGHRTAAPGSLWALRDISFDVRDGEVVGIVGRNGAGKSTLLKILSRITDPTEGFVRVRGRLCSLLEVGTGFHPELTGRENIFLNGAILGMRRAEIRAKLDEIVAFSGIERFLDTPAKRYSSGMYVRLAFAVGAHLDPDILVVDEVLAVGDAAFQKKCLGKMDELRNTGRTVLFVSHNMAAVQNLCHRVLVLDEGQTVFSGSAREAIVFYLLMCGENGNSQRSHLADLRGLRRGRPVPASRVERIELFTDQGKPVVGGLPTGSALRAHIYFRLEKPVASFDVSLGFNDLLGQRVFTAHSMCEPERALDEHVGEQVFVCEIPSLTLVPGEYSLKVGLDIHDDEVDAVEDAIRLTIVGGDYYGTGKMPRNGLFLLDHHWRLA